MLFAEDTAPYDKMKADVAALGKEIEFVLWNCVGMKKIV